MSVQPLPIDDAVLDLQRQMADLARAVDAEPRIVDVVEGRVVDGVARLLVYVDIDCDCGPIGIPLAVRLDGEPISTFLGRLVPQRSGETLH
jgi:hypothetical protein